MPSKPSHDLSTNSILERSFQGKSEDCKPTQGGHESPQLTFIGPHVLLRTRKSSLIQTITVKHIWKTYTPWIETLTFHVPAGVKGAYEYACGGRTRVHAYVHVVGARVCHGMSSSIAPHFT